jgi:H+-translocating NAD(P) transhydrogenase subunit alpha
MFILQFLCSCLQRWNKRGYMFDIILMFLVLILTFIIGYHLISKVPPLLHTPLMSMTNAISGITILAAVLVFSHDTSGIFSIMGFIAVILATLNVVGGFTITDRMLKMFKKNREDQTGDQR